MLEAAVHKNGYVSVGAVFSGNIGSSGGRYCHCIGIIGGQRNMRSYKIVCTPETGGLHTLADMETKR